MGLKGIPAFRIHSAEAVVPIGPKFLSEQEFGVIVFAASGISASSRVVAKARITAAIEWSKKGKKTILHKG